MRILILLHIFISTITSIEVYNDNPENGLIFSPREKIYVEEFRKNLYYTFDVPSARYIISWEKKVSQMCSINGTNIIKFNTNQCFWNNFNPEPIISSEIIKRIEIDFIYDKILNDNIEAFNIDDDKESECETLFEMAQNFNNMNSNLNKLSRLDYTSLDEILSFNKIISDVENLVVSLDKDQYTFAFNLSRDSMTDFFRSIKFNFYHDNFMITLAFNIPFYKRVTLYEIYKKPIVKKNDQYILKSDKQFAYFLAGKPLFLNENYFLEFCFSKHGKNLCSIPQGNYPCELGALNFEESPTNCLMKLPRKNVLTKIGNDLYVSPLKPLIFTVDCGYGKYLIQIEKHSKITNDMECLINSTNFLYNPKNKSNSMYELFIVEFPNENEQFYHFQKKVTSLEFYLTLIYILLVVFTYLATICVGFYKLNKKIQIAKQDLGSTCSDSTSSIHLYASIKETA